MLSHITPSVLYFGAAIYLLLIVVGIVCLALNWLKPKPVYAEMLLRLRTFWILVIVLTGAMLLGHQASIVLWAAISFLALKEYLTMIPTRQADHRLLFWCYAAIPLQYFWIWHNWYGMFVIFIPVYVFLFLPARMIFGKQKTQGFLVASGTLTWGLMMMVYCVSYVSALFLLPASGNPAGGAAGLILFLLFLNQFNDFAQFVCGKSFGKHKIIPEVSPKKTVEGFVGGVIITTMLAYFLAPYLTPMHHVAAICAGVIISASGFIGDVVMSALKRDLGVKDTGTLLPGHGGILDRIDSLVFAAPLFFHFMRYFYY